MNKKKILFISGIVLLILLFFMCGNTFAKYLTTYKTSANLQIAKWKVTQDFLINGKSSKTENFDLITTYDPTTLVNGKIAPGTSGTFGVNIDASETETGINYDVIFKQTSGTKPQNLVFTYNGKTYKELTDLSKAIKGNIPADETNKILNLIIGWEWKYETVDEQSKNSTTGDTQDTTDGQNISQFGFDVTITCTQDLPKKIS